MAATLLLDTLLWDMVLDVSGNIALATEPYSQAQDAASAIRTFEGELWFNTVPGLPYFSEVLGENPPLALLKERFNSAALTVPGVATATTIITSTENRTVTGQVQITNDQGQTSTTGF